MRLKGLVTLVLVAIFGALLTVGPVDAKRRLQQAEESVGPGACSGNISGDFDNNDSADLAVGVPGEDLRGEVNAGAVNVIYGSSSSVGLTAGGDGGAPANQFWHQGVEGVQNSIEPRDKFGRCVAGGDFNDDGYFDLAIGVPEEGLGTKSNVGVVHVIYGSQTGLGVTNGPGAQLFTQTQPVAEGPARAEEGDEFGSALAPGDFNNDGVADLAIGAPLEDDGGVNSGSVLILYGADDAGLGYDGSRYLHEGIEGVADDAEGDDKFGASLAAGDADGDGVDDLAVGVPEENIPDEGENEKEAGSVHVFYGLDDDGLTPASDEVWTQDSPGILDESEHGDNFGWSVTFGDFNDDSFDDLAVGTTHETVLDDGVDIRNAGAVNVIYGTVGGLSDLNDQFWHQGNTGTTEELGKDDFFGASLVASDFQAGEGTEDLAIGVPGETVSDVPGAGAVEVLYGEEGTGLDDPAQLITQNTPDVEDEAERNDNFGQAVAAGSYDQDSFSDLAIGIPGENISGGTMGDGAVAVIYATNGGLSPTANPPDEFWHQDSPGIEDRAETNDLFGRALASTLGNGEHLTKARPRAGPSSVPGS